MKPKTLTYDASLREYGRARLCAALTHADGDKVLTADRLGLDLRRLIELIDELKITRKDY